jgi:hypothetical protein
MTTGDAALSARCGSCARFVRVREIIDSNGEVRRAGDCLLEIWPSPLYEERTCNRYVAKGTFKLAVQKAESLKRRSPGDRVRRATAERDDVSRADVPLVLPEDLLDMDAEEFRKVLASVIREELSLSDVELAPRFRGGEFVLVPGKEGTQEKRVSLDSFFHKIVMIRDRLRVLEQKINTNAKLEADEKVQMQQYITQCYGTLTTFNVLFAEKEDGFVGQKSE